MLTSCTCIQDITTEQVNEAVKKWILPVFDSSSAIAAIASSKSKSPEIAKQLKEIGFEVDTIDIVSAGDEDASDSEAGSSEDGSSGNDSWSEVEHNSDAEMKA